MDAMRPALRTAKRRVALLAGLADLGGAWSLEQVTGALTSLADMATQAALDAALAHQVRRGKLPDTDAGLFILAMGKMGAHELNYSSDIDLICLFDETQFDPADYAEARTGFVRAVRRMTQTLSDRTADGYVFRTDLRLRPDASVTPVAISMETAERYYESFGRTWERAAFIKARVCAGDAEAGARFLDALTPFVWRRHLDFAAIQDAHDMRLRIRDHKGLHGPLRLPRHDMKLGRGGIREIEFFTQTRQLIAGGRDPYLRDRHTVQGLRKLAARGWVPEDVADKLADHYRFHREVEHRIQMVNDAQTHLLPKTEEGLERIACLMGRARAGLEAELRARLTEVHVLTEGFFAPEERGATPEHSFDPEILERWASYPALRSQRAVEIFARLRPEILKRLSDAAKPDEALLALDGFLKGLPAGVQLFSLFEANPQLIDLIVDIADSAPELALYLSRNARVFDAVIGGDFFADWPGTEQLRADLDQRDADAEPVEDLVQAMVDRQRVIGDIHMPVIVGPIERHGPRNRFNRFGQVLDVVKALHRAVLVAQCRIRIRQQSPRAIALRLQQFRDGFQLPHARKPGLRPRNQFREPRARGSPRVPPCADEPHDDIGLRIAQSRAIGEIARRILAPRSK